MTSRDEILVAPHVYQQAIERELGAGEGTLCAPTAFYIALQRMGHPIATWAPAEFVQSIAQHPDGSYPPETVRADLSKRLREVGAEVVSWSMARQAPNIALMRARGYLHTSREVNFFRTTIVPNGRARDPIDLVVAGGHRVIATMAPGFGSNSDKHAVVLEPTGNGGVSVIDPDERNPYTSYTPEQIRTLLQPDGACSIILPPAEQATANRLRMPRVIGWLLRR